MASPPPRATESKSAESEGRAAGTAGARRRGWSRIVLEERGARIPRRGGAWATRGVGDGGIIDVGGDRADLIVLYRLLSLPELSPRSLENT